MKERIFRFILNCPFAFRLSRSKKTPCRKCRWHHERYVMRIGLVDNCKHPDSRAYEYTLTGKCISLATTTRTTQCRGEWWEHK